MYEATPPKEGILALDSSSMTIASGRTIDLVSVIYMAVKFLTFKHRCFGTGTRHVLLRIGQGRWYSREKEIAI